MYKKSKKLQENNERKNEEKKIKEFKIMSKNWKSTENKPYFTIITPVYNREETIVRTMKSVEQQTYKNFEYVIIDDGSTDNSSIYIQEFMKTTSMSVMYIHKHNGGVHTARNLGYKLARGRYIICIDSDDELLPNACESFRKAWEQIPDKSKYWQVKALCIDETGELTATKFPESLNSLPLDKRKYYFSIAEGEQIGCRRADILKNNLFPEAKGVKFITENILWCPLENKYYSWGINDVVRIYHTEGENHLSSFGHKKTLQDCRNAMFESSLELNDWNEYKYAFSYKKTILRYCIMKQILQRHKDKYCGQWSLNNARDKILENILFYPALFYHMFMKKRECKISYNRPVIMDPLSRPL